MRIPPVGTAQHYKHLIKAIKYYEKAGFRWLDVPWVVSHEAVSLTRPAWVKGVEAHYEAGGEMLYPVASAEQSFLQMQLDAVAEGQYMRGSYVTMTPCFRNETVVDALHLPYFMKVELISWDKVSPENLDELIAGARFLFEEDMSVDVVTNSDPDPLGIIAYDLVAHHTKIELGSYGIRSHPKVGRWVYGTGIAEPRYSYTIEAEAQAK